MCHCEWCNCFRDVTSSILSWLPAVDYVVFLHLLNMTWYPLGSTSFLALLDAEKQPSFPTNQPDVSQSSAEIAFPHSQRKSGRQIFGRVASQHLPANAPRSDMALITVEH